MPAGTPAGSYPITYQICETLNPANCSTAIATVVVSAAPILADADTLPAVNGATGGATQSVFNGDTLNGVAVTSSTVTVSITDGTALPGATINTDGTITVPAGTPAGSYPITYQICETLNPANCSTAIATVVVDVPPITADDDALVGDGAIGGTTPSVLEGDLLNGMPVTADRVTLTLISTGGVSGLVLNPDGTLTIPAGTPPGTYSITYQICEVLNPANCATASVTLTVLSEASVTGIVYFDANGDDVHQSTETLLTGYRVEVYQNGVLVGSAITGADGAYSIGDLAPWQASEVRFVNPATGVVVGTISSLTLSAGEERVNLNLPIDPSGVVYNVATGEAVSGARLTVLTAGGTPLPTACFVHASQQNQTTDASGRYQFDIVPGADALCPTQPTEYRITVELPNGTQAVWGFNPANFTSGPLDSSVCAIDAIPGTVCEVSASALPPSTTFFAAFLLGQGSRDVINNHIPVNFEASATPLQATKTASVSSASVGSVITYTITVRNGQTIDLNDIDIIDRPPAGLKYVPGSARVNGADLEPTIEGRNLIWSDIDIAAGTAANVTLALVVGAGAQAGEYINEGFADNGPGNLVLSNVGQARIRIVPDEVFDCSEVTGKVFEDLNRNGVQDEGEQGLAGVRLATVNGLVITTDEFGRYHIACAATPKPGIGSNFILKLDSRTLPTGFVVTTENPRVIRLTQGKMSQLDFGASLLRIVEFQLTDEAFEPDDVKLKPEWQPKIAELISVLSDAPSVLRLAYAGPQSGARLKALTDEIKKAWREKGADYDLLIDTESVTSPSER